MKHFSTCKFTSAWRNVLQRSRYWTLIAIMFSVGICLLMVLFNLNEIRLIQQTTQDASSIRQARIDLIKGFMHISFSSSSDTPYQADEGEALLKQSVQSFGETLARTGQTDPESAHAFQENVSAFLTQLEDWKTSGQTQDKLVRLRIAFADLERRASFIDRDMRQHVQQHLTHLFNVLAFVLTVAVILLAGICFVVIHAGRRSDKFEVASHTSSERFRLAMETTKEGLWDLDVETGDNYYSPGVWRMLGYTTDVQPGRFSSWFEAIHPDDRDQTMLQYQDCLKKQRESIEVECRLKTADGTWKWVLTRGRVIEWNAQGQARRILGTLVDITEPKQMMEALRQSEEQFRSIFHVVNVGIVQVDPQNGQILKSNAKYREITGYTSEELLKLKFPELTHPDDRASDWGVFQRAVRGETTAYTAEKRYIRKNGEVIWVVISASFLRDQNGTPIRSVGVCTDITAQRHAEEEREKLQAQLLQSQKLESVGRLAGGVAHDFNNVLGVIIGNVELMQDELPASSNLSEYASEILKAAERAASLTRQLLAFARKQTVAPKVQNLNDTVGNMLKMLDRLIGEDIDLAWIPSQPLWLVKMDTTQVDQILANLCVNARDAISGNGKVTIETANVVFDEAYCQDHTGTVPGEYVLLAVSDDGCGMDKEIQRKIFEPFFTTKAVGHGSGLGLATVFGIVKQNNGFINVYSEPGKGSTFKIYLPRHQGSETVESSCEQTMTPHGHGETVLLVEDDQSLLALSTHMLESEGYTVLAASTPDDAVQLAKDFSNPIHLLITDVIMPGMNGRDLQRILHETRPSMRSLFMSGYTANVIAHHGVLDANVQFIQKPFGRNAILQKVRSVLDAPVPELA